MRLDHPFKDNNVGGQWFGLRDDGGRFDPLTSSTQPGAKAGAVRSSLMTRMFGCVRDAGCDHVPVHQNETDQQPPDKAFLLHSVHHCLLTERRSLDRLLLLNARHHVVDLLLGQESALDVLLSNALLIDEHADR